MESEKERRIQQALADASTGKYRSLRQAAIANSAPVSTTKHRANGREGHRAIARTGARLTQDQERTLVQWIKDLQHQAMPPAHALIRDMANHLLATSGSTEKVGKHWITRLLKRHPPLETGRSRPSELSRLISLTFSMVDQIFEAFQTITEKYNITLANTWNMDEKGFQMGQISKTRVVFDKTDGPPASAATGTTSWVSIIECVNAVGDSINPFVIHISKEVQDRWFLPDNELPDWRWGFSAKGWTNNALGYDWLKEWFIPRTTRAQNHRLLILDGHESHKSVEFEAAASLNNIHLFFLPPHSSGVLQPLNTGAFSPLATHYRGKLQKYTPNGFATISQDTFARIYIKARPLAFTSRNIRAG